LYIPSFIEIRSGVSESQGIEICPFLLLWLLAFYTTACAILQAVITVISSRRGEQNLQFYYFFVFILIRVLASCYSEFKHF